VKKLILCFFVIISGLNAAHAQSCCAKKSSCDGMVALASNKNFQEAHLVPEPFDYKEDKGKMISFNTADGKSGNAFAVLSGKPTTKVLFVFHEWWGLNDYVKREAEKLQKDLGNVNVYAIDLYDGKVATTQDSAGKYMQGMNPERASSIIKGLISTLDKKATIATIGWCMGGSWSFQAALIAGSQAKACVMYYGFPETDVEKIKTLKTDILYFQGLQDAFISKETVNKFEADLKGAGKKIFIKKYEATHAFANPSNPKFNKEASADAYKASLTYLKKGLALK